MSITMNFAGKVIVVTGGTTGIGGATSERFAEAGASVAIASIDPVLDAAVAAIREKSGNDLVMGIATDVSNGEMVREMIRQTAEKFGRIDYLVNAAGIQKYGTVVDTDEATWDQVMNVNLKSCYLTSKYAIPEMLKTGGGAIVHVSSVQALATEERSVAYAASKGGINALTRGMALDHAREGIRVNAVCPGSIDSPMLRWSASFMEGDRSEEEVLAQWGALHPIGRIGRPEEVADFIAFLCSDRAGFMTGGTYSIDGGLLSKVAV